MHWLRHAEKDRADRFRPAYAGQKLARDVAGFQIGEDQHIGSALQCGEGECSLELLGIDGYVALHFAIDNQRWVGVAYEFCRPAHLLASGMLGAAETGEGQHGHSWLNAEPAGLLG